MKKSNNYWTISVLDCGYHIARKSNLTVDHDPELFIKLPYLAFLLRDGKRTVLVDNGINERYVKDGIAWGGCPADAGSKHFLNSLKKAGAEPEDVDLILYTHLHNDHAGNANYFPNTKSIVQKDEWYNINNTVFVERRRRDYDLDVIPYLANNPNLHKIEGDLDIYDGLRVIKTPGHTRGSMCVVAETENGRRIIVGDLFHMACSYSPDRDYMLDYDGVRHSITPTPEWPTIPSSLIYNYFDYYDSVDKVRAIADDASCVLCGHDPELMFRDPV